MSGPVTAPTNSHQEVHVRALATERQGSWMDRVTELQRQWPRSTIFVRLGALGLLSRGRLTLHLPLNIFRRGRHIAGRAIHRSRRRMFSKSSLRQWSIGRYQPRPVPNRVLHLCVSAAAVARACHRGADTEEDNRATYENCSVSLFISAPHVPSTRARSALDKRRTDQWAETFRWLDSTASAVRCHANPPNFGLSHSPKFRRVLVLLFRRAGHCARDFSSEQENLS